MKQKEEVQDYIEGLRQKVNALSEEKRELAGCVIDLIELPYVSENEKAYMQLVQLMMKPERRGAEFFGLLQDVVKHLATERISAIFDYVVQRAVLFPYSTYYERRPYRTNDPQIHIHQMLRKLFSLFRMEMRGFDLIDYVSVNDNTIDYMFEIRTALPDCIAYELDRGNGSMMEAMREIIYGDNQTALLTHEMLKGMFMSDQTEAYAMVGELLVAARLQEGLRQSIVERMDEGTIEAYVYMLQIIIEHNLIRYSSVVRALAVWTGLNIEAANQRVTAQLIVQAQEALMSAEVREDWLQDENANKVFMSLWATAVREEADLQVKVDQIMDHGQRYQKVVAQYVLANSQNSMLRLNNARKHLEERDAELLHWIIQNYDVAYQFNWSYSQGENYRSVFVSPLPMFEDKQVRRADFEQFRRLLDTVPRGGISGPSNVLEFVHYKLEPDDVVKKMLYLAAYDMDTEWISEVIAIKEVLSSELRGELLSQFVKQPELEEQRKFIFESFTDKSMAIREHALVKAKMFTLTEAELLQLEALLKLKTGTLRQKVIQILLQQPIQDVVEATERLLQSKSELQRLGALELLTEVSADTERKSDYERLQPLAQLIVSPTAKEQKLLDKLSQQANLFTMSNGFGLFDPARVNPLLEETRNLADVDVQNVFTLQPDKVERFIQGLDSLVHEHRDHEYEVEYYSGYKDTLLLGTRLSQTVPYAKRNELPMLEQYPLREVWEAYFQDSGMDSLELMQLYFITKMPDLDGNLDQYYGLYRDQYDYEELRRIPLLDGWRKEFAEKIYPLAYIRELRAMLSQLTYAEHVNSLIEAAFLDSPKQETFGMAEQTWAALLARLPVEQMEQEAGVMILLTKPWYHLAYTRVDGDDTFDRYFRTAYRFNAMFKGDNGLGLLDLQDFLRAYRIGIVDEQEIYFQVLVGEARTNFIGDLTSPRTEDIDDNSKLVQLRRAAVDRILEVELSRGELSTEVSVLAMRLGRIEGMEHWIRLVSAMDQDTFVRGYIYGYGNQTIRKETFSFLIRICHPQAGEDEALLGQLLEKYPITEKKLLEAAMYAPQWLEIVAKHLGWNGLRSAAWYFHAHINESFTAEKETIVAHYSPITPQEFNDGAFDIGWFEEAYATVGEERFKLLYDCAKYISGGSNHRRSQLFADAALGKLDLDKIRQSVESKRNKDHLLTYSLIPLSTNAERDVRERYEFIQKFLLQSKQFGAQRRASEGAASQIALGNLARNAGYADVTRLIWSMEAGKLEELTAYLEFHEIEEGLQVKLDIDEQGQSALVALKNDKPLKSIPSRLNKNPYIVRLKELKTELTDQYRRARAELERSMVNETAFAASELMELTRNPVLAPLIRALVFRRSDTLGYLHAEEEGLYGPRPFPNGSVTGGEAVESEEVFSMEYVHHKLQPDDMLVIAHPVHLYDSGEWSLYQRDRMEREFYAGQRDRDDLKRPEPFKQVFRELYLPNADELANGTVSRRYAGYQIQPKKAVSLLKGRQWTVSYEEGLQKVSYEHNLIASLYALADWFSPADTEAPTLETVQFHDRRTYKPVPFKDVPPIFFSEVMRDIDLVVSVAYVGGVDPEASLTTIEMRHVIVEESLRLLKIDNVRLDGNYARIQGQLGEYAVHLGSGNAFRQAAGALHIVPVHSQHRGRIFLPFLDEDPKTAEILSKVMLLAKDHTIKDPQIASQLKG